MPPKAKKADAKKAEKLIDDKTFGLKNKNKSKKVRVGKRGEGGKEGAGGRMEGWTETCTMIRRVARA